mgnify:CR=1 FL=1
MVIRMKKIICNTCGVEISKRKNHFKIKVKSPFINVRDFTAHCCDDCFEKLYGFFNELEGRQ